MKILNHLSEWFADLQSRERVLIGIGGALIVVAGIYMALLPAMQKNVELEERYQVLSIDIQWLREQSDVVGRLNNSCSNQVVENGKERDVITRMVRRNQLKLINLDENQTDGYLMVVSGVSANRVLQLTYQLACQGLALSMLDIESTDKLGEGYRATIEVKHVD